MIDFFLYRKLDSGNTLSKINLVCFHWFYYISTIEHNENKTMEQGY